MGRRQGNPLIQIAKYGFVYFLACIVVMPLLQILLSGFKTAAEVNQTVSLPHGLYLGNYLKVFSSNLAVQSFFNSTVISVVTIVLDILICSSAAYSLARNQEKIFGFVYLFFVSAMMIPAVANLASLYTIIFKLGLKDTRTALILIYAANQIPLGILLFTGFIKTIPRQLDEAAVIDGCNYWQKFYRIIFPLLKPVTTTFAITSLVFIWNDFLMPLMILHSEAKKTITLAVYSFVNQYQSDYGAIYAMLIVAVFPPALLFLLTQKYFYQGITSGAVKG